jgi:hypothetical protein
VIRMPDIKEAPTGNAFDDCPEVHLTPIPSATPITLHYYLYKIHPDFIFQGVQALNLLQFPSLVERKHRLLASNPHRFLSPFSAVAHRP